jgi:predicted RNA binding protein YcfA (HicA-like mRNA interferase family)
VHIGDGRSCHSRGDGLIRRLKAAGFVEQRRGKGSHRQFVHPDNGRLVTVSVHTKKEVGTGLGRRILKEAGLWVVGQFEIRFGRATLRRIAARRQSQ